jgi:hypothetical protein
MLVNFDFSPRALENSVISVTFNSLGGDWFLGVPRGTRWGGRSAGKKRRCGGFLREIRLIWN